MRITTTPSCVVDEDKKYVFAARPTPTRRLFHLTAIVELDGAICFTRGASGRPESVGLSS